MVSFDYSSLKNTADRLIKQFGQPAIIRRATSSGDAWDPSQTTADHAVTVVVTDYDNHVIDGTRILATDRKALVAKGSMTIEPAAGDALVLDGAEYPIVRVLPLNPGGTVILWEAQVRF